MSGVSPDCISVDIFYEAKPAWPETLVPRLSGQAGFASIKVIEMPYAALVEKFTGSIAPEHTTIYRHPQHILIFGGPAGVGDAFKVDASCRHVLINKAYELRHPLASSFIIPESYPEWNLADGYHNLVEFELDAGYLARAIVLIVETAGSIAELGSFCMDETLRKRLLVVIKQEYVRAADSFIYHGPIKLIKKDTNDFSVCAVDHIGKPMEFGDEVIHVLDALDGKLKTEAHKPKFSSEQERDRFLLIADLVDLFRALLISEIQSLLDFFGIKIEKSRLNQMIWQLKLFNLIQEIQVYEKIYFVAFKGKDHQLLDYTAPENQKNFSRPGFKALVQSAILKDQKRRKAIEQGR
ncbi:retron St85 family effector protein [Achromobacter mucicolens]|uniref:retron St85 family effector protein n=1 Tax=Achromobacter mucicolens TaxID=1389922 RepID=UPI0028B076C6|nr:retron St85 family effector protein [Achromobacter mucicolens]